MFNVIRLGITGGIGSGKSTAAKFIAEFSNGVILDADAISRQATAPGGSAIPAISRICGNEFIDSNGGMNRPIARLRAFNDPVFRKTLESIIHPIVHGEIARIEMECVAHSTPVAIYDIPLLVESGKWRSRLDQILVVDCSEATQIHRVQSRNQMHADDVLSIIRTQVTRTHRLTCADMVLCNDRISLSELEKQCRQVSNILCCKN